MITNCVALGWVGLLHGKIPASVYMCTHEIFDCGRRRKSVFDGEFRPCTRRHEKRGFEHDQDHGGQVCVLRSDIENLTVSITIPYDRRHCVFDGQNKDPCICSMIILNFAPRELGVEEQEQRAPQQQNLYPSVRASRTQRSPLA
jgi:hypothetical protein